MTLHGIKLVTFDATNTLLKFRVPPWEYYAKVANDYGVKADGNRIKPKILKNYKFMIEQYPNFGRDSISWEQWWKRVIEMTFQGELQFETNKDKIATKLIDDFRTITCWRKADGAEELISALKKSGAVIGVISNFDPRLHEVLHNLDITKWFEFVLTSYEVGFSKPDKRIFELAKNKMNITETQCLHIGDHIEKDYNGAKAAGWNALLLIGENKIDLFATSNTFSSLKDITDAIKKNDLNFS